MEIVIGWEAIADVLTTAAEVPISVAAARDYAAQGLPVRVVAEEVTAELVAVVDWCIDAWG